MYHAALNQLFTLVGGFAGADSGRHATITGTRWTVKVGRRDWTPGHPVGDVAIIEQPRDVPGQEP